MTACAKIDVQGADVAVLYAYRDGPYSRAPGVDIWCAARDARLYDRDLPVVAHPPCSRWCRLAGLVEARWGHARGDDGGCFAHALDTVRRVGGVIEHPAYSLAWPRFDLPTPPRDGGWVRDIYGGWSCHVEQGRYGHPAKKATWLYAHGVRFLPSLAWGYELDSGSSALVSWCGNKTRADDPRPRITRRRASETPEQFRDVLLSIARSCRS